MKKINYLINIVLLSIAIFLGIKLYEKDNEVEVIKKYYYECSSRVEKETYKEVSNYKIDINNDYSIKNLETSTTYLYNEIAFKDAKKGYLSINKKVIIDEDNHSITVPGDNSNINENMWAITFVEQLENNNFTCTLKNN